MSRIHMALRTISACSNWTELFIARVRRTKPNRIVLRASGSIRSTAHTDLWNHYSDIWLHQAYGPAVSRLHNTVVIDCGANIGLFTLYALSQGARRVIAIEPDPQIYGVLAANTDAWGDRCTCVQAAVWDQDGRHFLEVANASTESHLVDAYTAASIVVATMRLKTLLDCYTHPKDEVLLKLDCEGAEAAILEDGLCHLGRFRAIVMEYHSADNRERCIDSIQKAGLQYAVRPRNNDFGMILATRRQAPPDQL